MSNSLVKEAAIQSKQAGERNIAAWSVKKATPVSNCGVDSFLALTRSKQESG